MISDTEKRRFLLDMADKMDAVAPNSYGRQMLLAIASDYSDESESRRIKDMRPWFESMIAQGKTVHDMAVACEVERHRIVFALKHLGLTAREMSA